MKIWRLCIGLIVGLGFGRLMAESPSPRRDINAVLAAHDRQLLDLPAVVGVYVGVLADGKTPCLKVMLARPTPETERKIPRDIEGYRGGDRNFRRDSSASSVRRFSGAVRNFEQRMLVREARSTFCDRRRDALAMPPFSPRRLI
jgi:hypothetical protein